MKILIVSPVSDHAVAALGKKHEVVVAFNAPQEEIKRQIVDCDVLVFRSGPDINADIMQSSSRLSLLIRAGSGLDNLDLNYVQNSKIALRRIEAPGARAVAELSFALMLSLARQILRADTLLKQGHWAKHELTGLLLFGKTLGIYGAGNIGGTVGQMGAAWGMNVIGCVDTPTESRERELASAGIRLTNAEEVLSKSDFLSLHLPLQPSTRGLIGKDALALMKSTAFITNLARGGVVDEQALLEALQNERLAGAGMDVHKLEGDGYISPLASLPNVILTPHIGSGTIDTQYAIGEEVIAIVDAHDASSGN
jgi:D-3-phosphoglycerate dehydrogenase